MQKINRNLLPNICFDCSDQLFAYDGRRSPLEQALSVTKKSLYLTAAGGVGKTTTLRSFWLDFLHGKHDVACLYVDLKLLDTDEDNAISAYLHSKYKLSIQNIGQPPILLLDGANEANSELREGNECTLVRECKQLMRAGCRMIITSRSERISIGAGKKEFSDMQYGELLELTDEQIFSVTKIPAEASLHKLLHNNMMLSIYKDLKHYGIKISPDEVTAGMLLKLYSEICLKVRYIKNYIGVKKEDREIYELISRKDKGEKIIDGCKKFNKIHSALREDPLNLTGISHIDKELKYSLEHLSLIEGMKDNSVEGSRYVWTNELYQTFYEALLVVQLLKENRLINHPYMRNLNFYKEDAFQHYYDVLQFAGEISGFSAKELNNMYFSDMAAQSEYCVEQLDYKRTIMIISVLSGHGIPESADYIPSYTFWGCERLKEITIPNEIRSIEAYAFADCTNLEKVSFGTELEIIGSHAFSFCEKLREVKLGDKVKFIGDAAFYYCKSVKKLELGLSVKYIGDSSFYACGTFWTLTMGTKVKYIGESAFRWSHINRIDMIGQNDDSPMLVCHKAFCDCYNLETVSISGRVILQNNIFGNCFLLKSIYCEHSVQPESWDKDWLGKGWQSIEEVNVYWGVKEENS